MTLRSLLVLAFVSAALVGSGLAAAQTPTTAKLAITDLAPGPAPLAAGSSQQVTFKVNLQATGVQCTSDGPVVIDLIVSNAAAAPAGVHATIEPKNITITIPAGVYADTSGVPVPPPTGGPFNGSKDAVLKIVADPGTVGGTFQASVSAAMKDGQPPQAPNGGCVGTLPASQATGTHSVVVSSGSAGGNSTTPSPSPGGSGNSTGNTTAPPPEEPAKKSPGLEPLVAVAAIGAIAVLRRRQA